MKSNYRRIGDFIERNNVKNKENLYSRLLGINIDKYFMPSVANVVGTDLSKYKIVKPGQFSCNRMHVGRDYRLPIAISKEAEPFIVSPAYDVFEIIKPDELLGDYLMMWFSRAEFDRNTWFYTDTDVRGKLGWDSLCDMTLPIPPIEQQQAIVAEYQTVTNRIQLNEQINAKLEETAQALYRHWFVDFEFPDENGKPYKSSGGKMVWNEELDKEVPEGWEYDFISNLSSQFSGISFKGEHYSIQEEGIRVLRGENVSEQFLRWDTPKFWPFDLSEKESKCLLKPYDIVIGMDGSKVGKNWSLVSPYELPLVLAQRVTCLRGTNNESALFLFYSFFIWKFKEYVSQVQTGTSVPHISAKQIKEFKIIIPKKSIVSEYNTLVSNILQQQFLNKKHSIELGELKSTLLSKMASNKSLQKASAI